MQIILLKKVAHLGNLGDLLNVKAGYARNFLIPQGKAVAATKKNVDLFKARRIALEDKLANILAIANARAEKINTLGSINIVSKAGNKGKLFGSVGPQCIADAVTAAGVKITKSEVCLPNGVLRTTGEHKVNLHFHDKVSVELVVNIITE